MEQSQVSNSNSNVPLDLVVFLSSVPLNLVVFLSSVHPHDKAATKP